jgi:hypothetical protein
MDRWTIGAITIGAGLACIFHYQRSRNRMYLIIGIVAIVATLANFAIHLLP